MFGAVKGEDHAVELAENGSLRCEEAGRFDVREFGPGVQPVWGKTAGSVSKSEDGDEHAHASASEEDEIGEGERLGILAAPALRPDQHRPGRVCVAARAALE